MREHLLRIDDTFKRHDFIYRRINDGTHSTVLTTEEIQYPAFAAPRFIPAAAGNGAQNTGAEAAIDADTDVDFPEETVAVKATEVKPDSPVEGHLIVPENTRGWSYERVF